MGTDLMTREASVISHPAVEKISEALRKELSAIEEKVVTGFTLADAMRLGAAHTGQKVGGWVEGNNSCALGAASLAAVAAGYGAAAA